MQEWARAMARVVSGSEQGKRQGEWMGAKEEGRGAAKRQHRTSISSEGMEGVGEPLGSGDDLGLVSCVKFAGR